MDYCRNFGRILFQSVEDADKHVGLGFDVLFNWLNKSDFKMYSGVGYKISRTIEEGIHLVPFGVAYGRKIFGFVEIGTGSFYFPARGGIGIRF